MRKLINKIFGKKDTIIVPNVTPDFPCPFGYKTAWYAIKNETPQSVIEKLKLNIVCESNWEFGINYVYKNDNLFISPQIDGYVLVVGIIGLSHNMNHEMVKKHSILFDELQYFGSHRVVDYYAWIKFAKQKLIRAYAYLGESGEVEWNEGIITAEEVGLGFDKFPVSEHTWEEDEKQPDEEDVIDIAKAWGVDPTFSDANIEKSTGYICGTDSI